MPKFCGKCGSKIDETTGLCPICNKNNNLHIITESDKSDSPVYTDIDTVVTSNPEYAEEKATDISEKAVVSKFCKKCGSKIDETTGLCLVCNKNNNLYIITESDKTDSPVYTDIDTVVTSNPEYAEEKTTDISEKAVVSKFCKKCGSKIDETTGLCPVCNKNNNLHIITESDKSDSPVCTDIDTVVTSNPEYAEEKTTDILEKAVVSKFCKKCGSKIDADTGLCPKCAAVQNYNDGPNNPDKKSEKESDSNSEYEKNPDTPIYQDDFYKENPDDLEPENKMSTSRKITILVIVTTVVLIVSFALLDLFGVIGTGIFRNFGIDPINPEIMSTESTEIYSSVIETTITETTVPNTTKASTVPQTTKSEVTTQKEIISTTAKASSGNLSSNSSSSVSKSESKIQEPTEKILELWQMDLIECCIKADGNEDAQFVLIYVNNDDIPEIYAIRNPKSEYDNYDMIYCADNNGNTNGTSVPCKSLYYYERGNLCCGHTDDYDSVWTINGGWTPSNETFDINSAIYAPNCISYTKSEIIKVIENM